MIEKREGVIKFTLHFTRENCLSGEMIGEIESWRTVLHRLRLIGRSADRYGGHGYGNISVRHRTVKGDGFIISGTQTGGLPALSVNDYALVTDWDLADNVLVTSGACKPSSEALTHGHLYRLDDEVGCVVHGHCPEIWHRAAELQLPITAVEALYGTPEMAQEVERLFESCRLSGTRLMVMGGHRDGVISYGHHPAQAVMAVIEALAGALAAAVREAD